MATSRDIHPDTVRASVILSPSGPASYGGIAGTFFRGKAKQVDSRVDIQHCLNVGVLRTIQFDAAGSMLADTDAEAKPNGSAPRSVRKHSETAAPIQLSAADKIAEQEKAKANAARIEREWLAEQQAEARGETLAKKAAPQWDASMSRAKLAEILADATGEPVESTVTKAQIMSALEALSKA